MASRGAVARGLAMAGLPLAALAALATGSCRPVARTSGAVAPSAGRETVIGEDEIARMSVRTAWDVVRMRAPQMSFGLDQLGRPARVRIQEPRSVNADASPLLVVDRMQIPDIDYLEQIPAEEVHAIRILDAEAAEPIYGLSAAGGAVVVETKQPR